MPTSFISKIAQELQLDACQIQAVADLLEKDASIPFIARYRKEATGCLDEVAITTIRDRLLQLKELEHRKSFIRKTLERQGQLDDNLRKKIDAAETLTILEDIYLPYKLKRRTRAAIAREKGLEPLAKLIFEQKGSDPQTAAGNFIQPDKGVESIDNALEGARDIIAEWINEDPRARSVLRRLFSGKAVIKSQSVAAKKADGRKYNDYFDWEEPAAKAPSHRILAMFRGEKEGFLKLSIQPPAEEALDILKNLFTKSRRDDAGQVAMALADSYKRLLSRSLETELRQSLKSRADSEAIRVFAENLRQLLMDAPLGAEKVMAIDPGFRTGCKLVCLDTEGKPVHHQTLYPHTSESRRQEAEIQIKHLCDRFQIQAIAVGSGTAGRETEAFLRDIHLPQNIQVARVDESGASIYSASQAARDEFPEYDLTVRGAISIGRRLMDPLSELVKIDPRSIGVGQYQHDVDPRLLQRSLDDVVTSCVNRVGVDVNRASVQLLTYVSGMGPRLAENIVVFRNENGPFSSRTALKAVPRFGPKAFEQSAGFLRITDGDNPLDASAVHPESYGIVTAMARDLNCSVSDLMNNPALIKKIELSNYISRTIGLPTLQDIVDELARPGRDPRQAFQSFAFTDGIETIEDLKPGIRLPGIVTNLTSFGVFVDIGVHQDGLVHISEMADHFVKNPADEVHLHQKVMVTVKAVDISRNRISLSMKTKEVEP